MLKLKKNATEYIGVRVDADIKRRVNDACKREGCTISALVSWLLERHLNETEEK